MGAQQETSIQTVPDVHWCHLLFSEQYSHLVEARAVQVGELLQQASVHERACVVSVHE